MFSESHEHAQLTAAKFLKMPPLPHAQERNRERHHDRKNERPLLRSCHSSRKNTLKKRWKGVPPDNRVDDDLERQWREKRQRCGRQAQPEEGDEVQPNGAREPEQPPVDGKGCHSSGRLGNVIAILGVCDTPLGQRALGWARRPEKVRELNQPLLSPARLLKRGLRDPGNQRN